MNIENNDYRRVTMATILRELRNNGASTSDWIGQLKGGAIYAYDLSILLSQSKGKIEFTKEEFEQSLKRVSRRIKPSKTSPR